MLSIQSDVVCQEVWMHSWHVEQHSVAGWVKSHSPVCRPRPADERWAGGDVFPQLRPDSLLNWHFLIQGQFTWLWVVSLSKYYYYSNRKGECVRKTTNRQLEHLDFLGDFGFKTELKTVLFEVVWSKVIFFSPKVVCSICSAVKANLNLCADQIKEPRLALKQDFSVCIQVNSSAVQNSVNAPSIHYNAWNYNHNTRSRDHYYFLLTYIILV